MDRKFVVWVSEVWVSEICFEPSNEKAWTLIRNNAGEKEVLTLYIVLGDLLLDPALMIEA